MEVVHHAHFGPVGGRRDHDQMTDDSELLLTDSLGPALARLRRNLVQMPLACLLTAGGLAMLAVSAATLPDRAQDLTLLHIGHALLDWRHEMGDGVPLAEIAIALAGIAVTLFLSTTLSHVDHPDDRRLSVEVLARLVVLDDVSAVAGFGCAIGGWLLAGAASWRGAGVIDGVAGVGSAMLCATLAGLSNQRRSRVRRWRDVVRLQQARLTAEITRRIGQSDRPSPPRVVWYWPGSWPAVHGLPGRWALAGTAGTTGVVLAAAVVWGERTDRSRVVGIVSLVVPVCLSWFGSAFALAHLEVTRVRLNRQSYAGWSVYLVLLWLSGGAVTSLLALAASGSWVTAGLSAVGTGLAPLASWRPRRRGCRGRDRYELYLLVHELASCQRIVASYDERLPLVDPPAAPQLPEQAARVGRQWWWRCSRRIKDAPR